MTKPPTTLFTADQFDFSNLPPTKSMTEDPDDAFLTAFLSRNRPPQPEPKAPAPQDKPKA